MTRKDRPIFLLGVGAQKCGTSWLFRTLQQQYWSNFGALKEYHVWDQIFCELVTEYSPPPKKDEKLTKTLRRMMQADPYIYTQYFKSLIHGDITLTGDMTPSYSLLEADHFKTITQHVQNAGFRLKVIFLMRDPVERMWSALRMAVTHNQVEDKDERLNDLAQNFTEISKQPWLYERTRYDKTIKSLESAFSADQIFYGFYESLFTEKTVLELSGFLGQSIADYDLGKRFNASVEFNLHEDQRHAVRNELAHVYEFCYEKFPICKNIWIKD